jgi:hypothetical protein
MIYDYDLMIALGGQRKKVALALAFTQAFIFGKLDTPE